ncbi:MAG: HD domain-containing phosphohydrolase [Candidatus Electryonea clarkiae]|nr:HD domain-containing phosphohydrolase [Candidatus Electryonea clarkiae]MDP8286322.1 HD domain-containing phosphohydrolase [Candidatus Electryonea clarkiae]
MVRMRDVLKSVKDVKQPGAQRTLSDHPGTDNAGTGFSFPSRELKSTKDTAPPENDISLPEESKPSATIISSDAKINENNGLYNEAIGAVDDFLKMVSAGEPFDLDSVSQVVKLFADSLIESDYLFTISLSLHDSVSTMSQHSVNVAIIALKVAIGMDYSHDKICEVGLSAMVHEAGMVRVPPEITSKKTVLEEQEVKIIKQHPIHGKAILEAMKDEYPFLPDVVAQEHERWDGSGYPFGVAGNDIHAYAQIIGLADTFVALTNHRHYRDNFIAYKAIQSIIERRNKDFSAQTIKILIDVISIFPVGSLVKLNDGSIAKVIRTHKQYPIRPEIEIVKDAGSEHVGSKTVLDLSKEPMIYIVSPIFDVAAYT